MSYYQEVFKISSIDFLKHMALVAKYHVYHNKNLYFFIFDPCSFIILQYKCIMYVPKKVTTVYQVFSAVLQICQNAECYFRG